MAIIDPNERGAVVDYMMGPIVENNDLEIDQVDPIIEDQEKDVPLRAGTRPNKDGTESTHLMRTEQLPGGNWVSFPSLFQNKDGSWVDMSNEKNWKETYKEARKRGEIINFGENKEKALAFGEGSWKEEPDVTKMLTWEKLRYEKTGEIPERFKPGFKETFIKTVEEELESIKPSDDQVTKAYIEERFYGGGILYNRDDQETIYEKVPGEKQLLATGKKPRFETDEDFDSYLLEQLESQEEVDVYKNYLETGEIEIDPDTERRLTQQKLEYNIDQSFKKKTEKERLEYEVSIEDFRRDQKDIEAALKLKDSGLTEDYQDYSDKVSGFDIEHSKTLKTLNDLKEEQGSLSKELKPIFDRKDSIEKFGLPEAWRNKLTEYDDLNAKIDSFTSSEEYSKYINDGKDILNQYDLLKTRARIHSEKIDDFEDKSLILRAVSKDYSMARHAMDNLGKFFFADMLNVFLPNALKWAEITAKNMLTPGGIAKSMAISDEQLDEFNKNDSFYKFFDAWKDMGEKYSGELGEEFEKKYPQSIKLDDVDSLSEAVTFVLDTATEQVNSIAITFIPMGVVARGTNALKKITSAARAGGWPKGETALKVAQQNIKNMRNLVRTKDASMGLFYAGTAAEQLTDRSKEKIITPKVIASIENQLKSDDTPNWKKKQLASQFEVWTRKKNMSEGLNFVHANFLGFAEGVGEYAGTLSSIGRLGRTIGDVVETSLLKRVYNASFKGIGREIFQEFGEETVTQILQNTGDGIFFEPNKTIFDGIDAEFFAKTAITRFIISGGNRYQNIKNVFADYSTTREDKKKSREILYKALDAQEKIEIIGKKLEADEIGLEKLSKRQRSKLEKEREDLIVKQVGYVEENTINRLIHMNQYRDLSEFQRNNLLDIEAELSRIRNKSHELGGQNLDSKEKRIAQNDLNKEYERLINKKDGILKDNRDKGDIRDAKKYNPEEIYLKSLYDLDLSLAFAYAEQNGLDIKIIPDVRKGLPPKVTTTEKADEEFKKFEEELDAAGIKDPLFSKSDKESTAGIIEGKYIYINQTVVNQQIEEAAKASDIRFSYAAVSPIHEVLHHRLSQTGFTKSKYFKPAVDELSDKVKEAFESGSISESDYNAMENRKKLYSEARDIFKKPLPEKMVTEEFINAYNDALRLGILSKNSLNDLSFSRILFNSSISDALGDFGITFSIKSGTDLKYFLDNFNKNVNLSKKISGIKEEEEELQTELKESKAIKLTDSQQKLKEKFTNEQLLRKRKNAEGVEKENIEAILIDAGAKIGLKAMGFDTRKGLGNISYEDALQTARFRIAERGLLDKFNPREGTLWSTYVGSALKWDIKDVIEQNQRTPDAISIDTEKAKQVADLSALETEIDQVDDIKRKRKINVLKGFTGVNESAITNIVKVKKGDTYKQISKYTGEVGNTIFDIPAAKIVKGNENLTYKDIVVTEKNINSKKVNKLKEFYPDIELNTVIKAESGKVQDFFRKGQNAENFIKILPTESVTSDTADINELGENIDVDRDVLGLAIGLKGLVQNYFYNKTNKRSKGKGSQPYIWKLKPRFINPTPKVIKKFIKDIGITAAGQANIYDRDIGQLLKGAAKIYSQQAAFSAAQRNLEATLPKAKDPAKVKKQISGITAAQSKTAFSIAEKIIGNAKDEFELEEKGIDKLLEAFGIESTINIKSNEGIKRFLTVIENDLLTIDGLGKEFWFTYDKNDKVKSSVFTASNDNYDKSMAIYKIGDEIDGKILAANDPRVGAFKKPKEAKIYSDFKNKIFALGENKNTKFGESMKGIDWSLTKTYSTIFGGAALGNTYYLNKIPAGIQNGDIKKWNENIGKIHKNMWMVFSKLMRSKAGKQKYAPIIGTYLKLTANDRQSWHRLGAQFVGYSGKLTPRTALAPKKYQGKIGIEFEHVMPATAAYLHLMNAALSDKYHTTKGEINFEAQYDLLIKNYKLIALDKAMDDKLRKAKTDSGYSLMFRMPDNWSVIDGKFWERYFNKIVAAINGGINPDSLIGLDGRTFTQIYKIDSAGNKISTEEIQQQKRTVNVNKKNFKPLKNTASIPEQMNILGKYDKAIKNSRSINMPEKGISVFDFDDTIAKTKSKVIVNMPQNLEGLTFFDKMLQREFDKSLHTRHLRSYEWFWDSDFLKSSKKYFSGPKTTEKTRAYKTYRALYVRRNKVKELELTHGAKELQAKWKKAKGENKENIEIALQEKFKVLPFAVEVSGIDIYTGKEGGLPGMKLAPAEFAKRHAALEEMGASFDFSEFTKVVKGKKGPLFDKLQKAVDKFGNENVFILTARPQASATAIQAFLEGMGVKFKIENITGLENGTPQAKANWIVSKVAEGYNDFYFADDVYKNVKAVQKVLDVADVKSDVQQAKFSKAEKINRQFNDIIEQTTGVAWYKEYSPARAKAIGKKKNTFHLIPPSAEDFTGLLYPLLGKGKVGDNQFMWLKEKLLDPIARTERIIAREQIGVAADYKALKKNFPKIPKTLQKQAIEGYTYSDVIRAWIWNKQGMEIPGLSKRDMKEINDFIKNNKDLETFASGLMRIQKGKQYPGPNERWLAGNITTDMIDNIRNVNRVEYLAEFNENADIIFSEENKNKLKAIYGDNYIEALENSIERIKKGTNKLHSRNRQVDNVMDWTNGSVGAIMFLNSRSAALQLISSVNFINWSDNNILEAGKAFANQKQYWKDVIYLMNSPMLVKRRQGLRINVSESEIADAAKSGGVSGTINYLLRKGFILTQIADSFAIASGGSAFYRNRINSLLKKQNPETGKNYTKAQAEEQAFLDFQEIAEENQQSSRTDKISMQQASDLGRIVLAFANTPMQYNRLIKKAYLDLVNGRGDWRSNLSKIIYYSTIQNIIFNALQNAMFAIMFDDDEDEIPQGKVIRTANGMADSLLRGMGYGGAAVSTFKNIILKLYLEGQEDTPEYEDAALELLDFSPPISSKVTKLRSAFRSLSWDADEIAKKGFSLDNPAYLAGGQILSASLNIPLDRVFKKYNNMSSAMREDVETWQRIALFSGWADWEIEDITGLGSDPQRLYRKLGNSKLKFKKFKTKKFK